MKVQNEHRINLIILILVFFSAILFVFSLKIGYPVYQNTHSIDPLAELSSLFPLYYVSLIITVISATLCFIFKVKKRGIHILILLLLASTLWYTRYYLSGFTWEPDSVRNLGLALHIPDILNGKVINQADYPANFPISYFIEYAIAGFSGDHALVYLHMTPLLNIITFTLLCYAFSSKLFNPVISFLMTFMGMLGMHYVIFIMGAHTIGMLLLLTALITICHKGYIWRTLSFIIIIITIMSHPITPILLGIFIFSMLAAYLSKRNIKSQILILCMLIICMSGWYIWPKMSILKLPENTVESIEIANFPTASVENIIPEDLESAEQYALGNAFVYEEIYDLNKSIYYSYGALVLLFIGVFALFNYRKYRNFRHFVFGLGGFKRRQIFLVICAPCMLILAVLLAEWDPILIERGLSFALLCISGIISSIIVFLYYMARPIYKTCLWVSTTIILFLFSFSFPFVTYSIDAYSSFPISEKSGFEFAIEHIDLKDKYFVSPFGQQLVYFYTDYNVNGLRANENSIEYGDIFFTRRNGYYYDAMRRDLSFEDNTTTRYESSLDNSEMLNRIYCNPTFSIYLKR